MRAQMPASTKRAASIYGAPVVAKRPSSGVSGKPKPANATSSSNRAWNDSTRGDRVSGEASSTKPSVSNDVLAASQRRSASSIPTRPLGASNSYGRQSAPAAPTPAARAGAAAKKQASFRALAESSRKKPTPKTKTLLSKGEYGKLIGVGPRQKRADKTHVDLALLKKDDASKNYDAFAEVEAGWRPGAALGSPVGGDAAERDAFADATRLPDAGTGGVVDGDGTALGDRRASRRATEYAPSIRFSKNPKYRTVTSDGVFVAPPDMSGEPPAPGSAADRAAHPSVPPRSTGDERLDRKRARAKAERERRAAETLASKQAASKARREAAAAEASVGIAELTFFRSTVQRMAKKYNALKASHDAKATELGRLVTDFAERDAKRSAQTRDTLALRGGGGALVGKPVSRSAAGAHPRADLRLEELRARVADAERNAEEERLRTEMLGHTILRLRESDPTTEARRADPHASLATTRETAVAASAAAESTVPWVARKLELVKQYQADASAAIEAERARAYAAANEASQARAMLARTIASAQERREAYAAQIGQRRMVLGALRAEDEAMARRKESFINRLAQMNKELAEEERDRKRGGKVALPGFSGGLAKAFITAMTGGALRTQEAKTNAAIRKLVEIIPDVTPEGLIEGFKNRKQRKTLTREASRARQTEHDALLLKRDELLETLARTKEELYNADESLDEDAATRAARGARPEDRADDGVFMAELATRATRLTVGDKEKELTGLATGVRNLAETVARFDETLKRTLRGWAAAVDDARESLRGAAVDDSREAKNDAKDDAKDDLEDAEDERVEDAEDARLEGLEGLEEDAPHERETGLMNATAREGIAYLETFYDALERANVVAVADLHRERVLAAAREQGVHPSKVVVSSIELDQTLLRPAVPALSALRRAGSGEKGAEKVSADASAAEEKKEAPKREGSFKGVTLLLFDESERFEVDSVNDDVHDAGFGGRSGSDAEPDRSGSPGARLGSDVSGNPFAGELQKRDERVEAKIGSGPARIVCNVSKHNLRVDVKAGSSSSSSEKEEEEEEEEEDEGGGGGVGAKALDPRLSQKAASAVFFRKGLKKGESAAWARETEARMARRKIGAKPARKPARSRQASGEGQADVATRPLGDDDAQPHASAE
jgi:hypothetical protein